MGSGSKLRGMVATPLKPGLPLLSGTMMPTSWWERGNDL